MGLRISTNLAALNAQRALGVQQDRSQHAMAELSSGSRIVHASDDAAGLAISENIKGQIRGLAQAKSNANNATSLIQVTEGGLNEITNIMTRVRELSVQAASDTVGDQEREFINTEASQLLEESNRIAKTTRFGNQKLLEGGGKNLEFQVGTYGDSDNIIKYKVDSNATNSALGTSGIDVSSKSGARSALSSIDEAMNKVSKMRADFGAVQSRLSSTSASLDSQGENLAAANSRLRDTDVAKASAELASANILQQASIAVMAQANAAPASALKLL
jgi:flagellin